jgi:hypothetical protein
MDNSHELLKSKALFHKGYGFLGATLAWTEWLKHRQDSICKALRRGHHHLRETAFEEVTQLEHRADQAESYANTAIFLAMATTEAAKKATLEAIVARRDAETKSP